MGSIGEKVEFGSGTGLSQHRTKAEVAPGNVICALNVTIRAKERNRPTGVNIITRRNAASQIDCAKHALVVEVTYIVHAAEREAQLAAGEESLGCCRKSSQPEREEKKKIFVQVSDFMKLPLE